MAGVVATALWAVRESGVFETGHRPVTTVKGGTNWPQLNSIQTLAAHSTCCAS